MRVTLLQIWYTANEPRYQTLAYPGRDREGERYAKRRIDIEMTVCQGAGLPRLGPQFVMRGPWVPYHEPEGRDCVIRWWGPFMRANVPSRRSRKARVKVTGMLIKETSLRYRFFAALNLDCISTYRGVSPSFHTYDLIAYWYTFEVEITTVNHMFMLKETRERVSKIYWRVWVE